MPKLKLDLQPQHLLILQHILQDKVPNCAVRAYGSRVFGRNHDASDLDLVLYQPQNPQHRVMQLHSLQQALRDSSLPILVEVSDWATLPEDFKCEIQRGFVTIQDPKPDTPDTVMPSCVHQL